MASPAPLSTEGVGLKNVTGAEERDMNIELKASDQSQGQETVHETGDLCSSHLDAQGHFKDTDTNDQVMENVVADPENQMQYSASGAGNGFAREVDEQHISEPLQAGGDRDPSITKPPPLNNAADEIAMTSTAHGNMGELEVDSDGKNMTIHQPLERNNTWYVLTRLLRNLS
jgi:hypothetical protein